MKVKLPKELGKKLTAEEKEAARLVMWRCDINEARPCDYGKWAAVAAADTKDVKMIQAKAEIRKNERVWDRLGEGSMDLDVWVYFTAEADGEIVMGGAYLTDIFLYDHNNHAEMRKHMEIRRFVEVKDSDGH